jgi:hypothetical protein
MLEDLSEVEATALGVNGHESSNSVNNADSLLDHNELDGDTQSRASSAPYLTIRP